MTLLLGPPGAGKTTLLKALAGKLQRSADLKVHQNNPSGPLHLVQMLPRKTPGDIWWRRERACKLVALMPQTGLGCMTCGCHLGSA